MAGALVLTPILLIVEIYDTDQFETLRDRPAFTAAAVGGCTRRTGGARRRDGQPAAAASAPRRRRAAVPDPDRVAGQTANLLVPLYGVIAAGSLAQMPALFRNRRPRERKTGR